MPKIKNQAFVDLRNFTPKALRKIKLLMNVTLVMLPENPTAEFSEAYAEIKKINVISETPVPGDARIFNGMTTLTKESLVKDSIAVCNGVTVVRDIPKEMSVRLIVNGSLIKSPTAFVEPIKINGTTHEIDDDAKLIKSVAELYIDKNFINNLTKKTAIIGCGKIYINDEITDEMLQSKGIVLYNVGQVIARKELHGYIQANSNNVALVQTTEEAEEREMKIKKRKFGWK